MELRDVLAVFTYECNDSLSFHILVGTSNHRGGTWSTSDTIRDIPCGELSDIRKKHGVKNSTRYMCPYYDLTNEMLVILTVMKQLKQLQRKPRKTPEISMGLNLWTPRYRCDALTTELWSLVGSRSGASSIYTRFMKRVRCVYDIWHIHKGVAKTALLSSNGVPH